MKYKSLLFLVILLSLNLVFADMVASPIDLVVPLVVLGIIGIIGFGIVLIGVIIIYFAYKYFSKSNNSKGKKK